MDRLDRAIGDNTMVRAMDRSSRSMTNYDHAMTTYQQETKQ
jgi:hypothetical protein